MGTTTLFYVVDTTKKVQQPLTTAGFQTLQSNKNIIHRIVYSEIIMESENMIPVSEFCIYHPIELSFIYSLNESSLIDSSSIEDSKFVPVSQLKHLEQLMRLKQEMEIIIESIKTITNLLQSLKDMQLHIVQLNDRVSFYET